MHIFEFGVTTSIDWRDVETVYVKAACSPDAIKFMHTLTAEDDESKPYADFSYRAFIPDRCLPENAVILDSTEPPDYVLVFSEEKQEFDWLEWYSVRMNDKLIGTIGRNIEVQEDYNFSAHAGVIYGSIVTNNNYSGSFETLEEAKEQATKYAEFLNKINF